MTTHQWPQRIKQEFGMTAKEVIKLFARDGYSMALTSGTLEISRTTLARYAKQEGIIFAARNHQRPECTGHGIGWPKGKQRGYSNNPFGHNQYAACLPFGRGKE